MHTDVFCSFESALRLSYFRALLHVIQYPLISTLYAKKKRTTACLPHVGEQLFVEAIDSCSTSPPDINAATDYSLAEAIHPLWKEREGIVHKADHFHFVLIDDSFHLICGVLGRSESDFSAVHCASGAERTAHRASSAADHGCKDLL